MMNEAFKAQHAGSEPGFLTRNNVGEFKTQDWDENARLQVTDYVVERITFDSQGVEIVGNLFSPAKSAYRTPAIAVMGPISYVKEQAPLQYASRLVKHGFTVLTFDPRGFGESSGEPRGYDWGANKTEDLNAAVAYLSQLDSVDEESIYALGLCQGVNWTIDAVNSNPLIRATALIAGQYLVPATWMLYLQSQEAIDNRVGMALKARERFEQAGEIEYIPVVSTEDKSAYLTAEAIYNFYAPWAQHDVLANHRGRWENKMTRMSEAGIWARDSSKAIADLQKPVLMIHSERAASGEQIPRQLFDSIGSSNKQLVWFGGRNQLQFYQDPLTVDAAVPHVANFFNKF
ncbi:Uncharacterized conserved protein [Serratia marcescens]|jgi:dienelactone hydrolase|uniref:alpha/beta hydrolase n=2 Tax=Serratia TaxID=613 RepID=UPI00074560BB|nr:MULTISPECIES: alpha/beta fold hydrolase [Serratia]MBH2878435.1 alpha/beta hydrolase [Serratia marcescens]QDI48362.1 alpha/beta hydrolase [Serratia marcescens]CUY29692.1 Uncharacterized conserved protein [Serratia marcescens]CUY32390.1 Uncharacterized conserved protein [Serratia marcescens]CUY50470.1 Uncharacterized conserved protein [Serratia marcescens]